MYSIRRGLRLWVSLWLVCQVALFAALLPKNCCEAHRLAASAVKPNCHKSAAASQCPMRAADGTPCPMHRGDGQHADQASTDGCAMRSTCSGPMGALVAQLSNQGVLPSPVPALPTLGSRQAPAGADQQLISRLVAPDAPPPRA